MVGSAPDYIFPSSFQGFHQINKLRFFINKKSGHALGDISKRKDRQTKRDRGSTNLPIVNAKIRDKMISDIYEEASLLWELQPTSNIQSWYPITSLIFFAHQHLLYTVLCPSPAPWCVGFLVHLHLLYMVLCPSPAPWCSWKQPLTLETVSWWLFPYS